MESNAIPADEVVGLLAEGDRLRVVAALVLGAVTLEEVQLATDLATRRAGTALARLVDAGLVEADQRGYRLREEELRLTAREAGAARRAGPDEHGDRPAGEARVLRAFVKDGRLLSIPAAKSKRLVVLDLLAQEFDPGVRYSEKQVNLMLGKWHADTAALRRYLVDEGFLDRAGGRYWRVGGSVET